MRTSLATFILISVSLLTNGLGAAQSSGNTNHAALTQTNSSGLDIRIPLQDKSVRFAVIGDSGTGQHEQYQVGEEMEKYREATHFNFVLMLGDNIYGGHSPKDFATKFEQP